jgi:GNAT superfamily N-acetyltransferase
MSRHATIRPASAQDEDAIDAVHARCVADVFAGLLGDYLPPREQRVERARSWAGPIGSPHPRHALLVAERAACLVGFTAVGPTRDRDDDRLTTGELRVLMVDAAERSCGVGLALVAGGEQAMRECGLADATLWVADANTRALRFYERCGWRADGTKRVSEVNGREIKTVRYRTRLAR